MTFDGVHRCAVVKLQVQLRWHTFPAIVKTGNGCAHNAVFLPAIPEAENSLGPARMKTSRVKYRQFVEKGFAVSRCSVAASFTQEITQCVARRPGLWLKGVQRVWGRSRRQLLPQRIKSPFVCFLNPHHLLTTQP
jgi:hypothetical protein